MPSHQLLTKAPSVIVNLQDLQNRAKEIRDNVFKIEIKEKRLGEIEKQLTKEEVWSDLDLSQKLSKEKTSLEKVLSSYKTVSDKISDSQVLLDVSIEENDDSSIDEISKEGKVAQNKMKKPRCCKILRNILYRI